MAERICQICTEDCSDRPRIKDPKGRYFCRACYDDAVAAKQRDAAPAPPTPAEDDGGLSWMDEVAAAEPAPMMSAASSTWDARKKSLARANKAGAKAARKAESAGRFDGGKPYLYSIVLGAIWFLGGLLGLQLERPFVLFFFAIIGLVYYMAYWFWVLIAAARERGVVEFVLCFFVPFWSLVFIFFRSENRYLRAGFIPLLAVMPVLVMWGFQGMESAHRTLDPRALTTERFSEAYVADLSRAISSTRRAVPDFRAAYLSQNLSGTFYVRGYIDFDPMGPAPAVTDQMVWIRVDELRDDGLWIGTVPWPDEVWSTGTTVTLATEALTDVMIVVGDEAAGGFTLIVERDYLLPDERLAFRMRHPYQFVGGI